MKSTQPEIRGRKKPHNSDSDTECHFAVHFTPWESFTGTSCMAHGIQPEGSCSQQNFGRPNMTCTSMFADTLLSQVKRQDTEEVAKALSYLQLPSLSLPDYHGLLQLQWHFLTHIQQMQFDLQLTQDSRQLKYRVRKQRTVWQPFQIILWTQLDSIKLSKKVTLLH